MDGPMEGMTREQALGSGFAKFIDEHYSAGHGFGVVGYSGKASGPGIVGYEVQPIGWGFSWPGAAFLLLQCNVARFRRVV